MQELPADSKIKNNGGRKRLPIIIAITIVIASFSAFGVIRFFLLVTPQQLFTCLLHPEINCWDPCGATGWGGCYRSPTNMISAYYKERAIGEKNPRLCYKVQKIDAGGHIVGRKQAIAGCLAEYSVKNQDLDVCLGIDVRGEHTTDWCLKSLAGSLDKPELCEQIENAYRKDECLLSFYRKTGEAFYCLNVTTYRGERCLEELVEKDPKVEYCENSKMTKKVFLDRCFYTVATKNRDLDMCNKAGSRKEECKIVVNIENGNIGVCVEATGNLRDLCYEKAAFVTKDNKYCDLISNQVRKGQCHKWYSGEYTPYNPSSNQ